MSSGPWKLRLELDRRAVNAGEPLTGCVVLDLERPAVVRQLVVEAAGREVLGAAPHYGPAVYRRVLPRPWGRARTGSKRLDYQVGLPLAGPATALPAGRHHFPFRLVLPREALPTYGGLGVVVEHEVVARLDLDGERATAWQPLHLWQAERAAPPPTPAEASSEAPASGLERVTERLRAPLVLRLGVDTAAVDLRGALHGWFELHNPRQSPVRHLVLELLATETTRHLAATDINHYVAARRLLPLRREPQVRESWRWELPVNVAPSLRSPRFRLEWTLVGQVTLPWALGVTARLPLELWDSAPGVAKSSGAEKDDAAGREPSSGA